MAAERRAKALALGLLLSLVLGEAALRIQRPHLVGVSRQPTIYQPDAKLGYRYVAGSTGRIHRLFEVDNEVRINGYGFHDEARGELSRPVVVLGDSFTAGLQVPVADTWTQVLQRSLRERAAPELDVVNLGLDGTGTDVQLALLEEELPRLGEPRLVLLAFSRPVSTTSLA